jgi:hypothetical protein
MFKDEKTGHSEFLPPYWWPLDNKPVVLFLDELNRARPEILQSIMDLTLNKTLAGKKLPTGSIIISAVNEGDEYQLTDLDPALVSRFNVYRFAPTVADWLLWADKVNIDSRIILFIQKNPRFLDGDDNTQLNADSAFAGLAKSPDRRAWERVSALIAKTDDITEIHVKTIAGIVGLQAAMSFKNSISDILSVSPEQILTAFEKHKTKLDKFQLDKFALLNEQIVYWINGDHYQKAQKPIIIQNLTAYLNYLKKLKQNEAIAHFASMLEDRRFEKATGFILAESPDIIGILEQYIKNIAL